MLPSRLVIGLSATLALGVALASAQADDFVTAEGRTVVLPSIDGMTCDQMNVTLTAIDMTRYRENAPTPHNANDQPLYRYEKMLACVHFHACVMGAEQARGDGKGGNDLRKCPEKK